MLRYLTMVGIAMSALAPQPAAAQSAQVEADPGVKLTRLIDRAEVRVSRLELQPGAARRVHAHDDVEYHLWIPFDGQLQITIESNEPVPAALGQAFFLQRGTTHGFKNVGTTPAGVFEIFVKTAARVGGADPLGPSDVKELLLRAMLR